MVGAAAVEVGTEGDHDRRAALVQVEERVDEAGSSGLVRAQREELLELVDDEERRPAGSERPVELRGGLGAGRHQRDGPASSPRERGNDASADKRRLAAPRRPHHRHEAAIEKPREDGGDDLLTAEEEVAVLGAERHEPAIGAAAARAGIERPGATSHPRSTVRRPREADVARQRVADGRGGPVVDDDLPGAARTSTAAVVAPA